MDTYFFYIVFNFIFFKKLYIDNTIDMTSTYSSHTHNEYTNIQFPKNPVICKNTTTATYNSHLNYDVYPVADRFDPNISSSPPNTFINTLKNRMDVYYTNTNSMKLNINYHITRGRALSLGH
jgi:hypothetical protein